MPPTRITNIYPFDGQFAFNVDYQGCEYRICFVGDWRNPPDLSAFPQTEAYTSSHVAHSDAVDKLWKASRVIGHGSDSHIRELRDCSDEFPICKVVINDQQCQFLQDEFRLLCYILTTASNTPVARASLTPLEDEKGISGYKNGKIEKSA